MNQRQSSNKKLLENVVATSPSDNMSLESPIIPPSEIYVDRDVVMTTENQTSIHSHGY